MAWIAEAKVGCLHLGHVEGTDTCSLANDIWIPSHYNKVPEAGTLVPGMDRLWNDWICFPVSSII